MTVALTLVALFWLSFTLLAWWNTATLPTLPKYQDLFDKPPSASEPPQVTVVVAGRDEQARIERTVRGLLGQQGVRLRLIVVDDRSSDDTPNILHRLQAEDPRLELRRIDTLPPGWLGKCHALAQGTQQVQSDWLLFTDADIHMAPDLLARAIRVAQRDRADHLTMFPGLNTGALWPRAALLAMGQCLALYTMPARVNRDRGGRGVGVGAFNLLRTDVYRAIGGHERLRMEVVDDVKLGWLVRQGGFRTRVYGAPGDIEAEWGRSLREAIRLTEKNWFAGMDYDTARSLAALLLVFTAWLMGFAGPAIAAATRAAPAADAGPTMLIVCGWLAFAAWLSPILPAVFQARVLRWPTYTALGTPFGFLVFLAAGVRSVYVTLRNGGVRWRDTFYPLGELRAGSIRAHRN